MTVMRGPRVVKLSYVRRGALLLITCHASTLVKLSARFSGVTAFSSRFVRILFGIDIVRDLLKESDEAFNLFSLVSNRYAHFEIK